MIDLNYDPASICGPTDFRVARFLEEYRGNKLDPSYIRHLERFHGGIPGKQHFDAVTGETFRVGRFLTMVDEKSELEPPLRPSWEFPPRDARIDWSVLTLIDQEGPSCRNLFGGDQLLPFAALYFGPNHPDGMSLTNGNTNLVCFFYESKLVRPRVVVWLAHQAQMEYFRWDEAIVENEDEEVRYNDFTLPVAADFDSFLAILRE